MFLLSARPSARQPVVPGLHWAPGPLGPGPNGPRAQWPLGPMVGQEPIGPKGPGAHWAPSPLGPCGPGPKNKVFAASYRRATVLIGRTHIYVKHNLRELACELTSP